MWQQQIGSMTVGQLIIALAIVVGFIILAFVVRYVLEKVVKKLVKKTKTRLDNIILNALRRPVVITVILAGLYLASLVIPKTSNVWLYISRVLAILLTLMGIFCVLILINTLFNYYRKDVISKMKNVGISLRLMNVCWIIILVLAAWLAVIAVMCIWGLDTAVVTGWLNDHGWRIALIIGLTMLLIVLTGEIAPRIVVRTLNRRPDEKELEVKKRSDTLSRVIVSTLQVFFVIIAIFMMLSELKIDIAPILASAGVVGIAIGFGAQSMVKDVLAGLFIIVESQYRVGDVVRIADVAGTVESINLRRTVLRDIDGVVHTVPNGEIRVASNLTKEWSRVNMNISVGYGEDMDHVISVINRVGQEMAEDEQWGPAIVKVPQVLRIDKFGDSGIDLKILGETQPSRQWEVMGELRLRLKKTFDKEGIEIPWPHTKLYFGNTMNSVEKQEDK